MTASRLSIAFLVDSVPFTTATVAGETSLGGSESSCLGLARALRRRGHDIHVYASHLDPSAAGPDHEGVVWHPIDTFQSTNQWLEWDVVVALRDPRCYAATVEARLRLLWNQDLLVPGTGGAFMSIAWALDHLVYVSGYHRKQWGDQVPELAPLGWVTKNGYDPRDVPAGATKDPNRIIHISRPERGLAPLLQMWPALRTQYPQAELRLCRYASMYDGEGTDARAVCDHFDREVARVQAEVGGLTVLGALNKPALYREIAAAAVMWYPGVKDFGETSCVAAVEAQACGTPFVGSYKGALPETVPDGSLVKGDAETPEYQELSIAAVVGLLHECRAQAFGYRSRQRAGQKHVEAYTFDVLAGEWEAQIETWFRERYASNRVAVLRQLLHEDDHVAAKQVAQDIQEHHLANLGSDPGGTVRAQALRDEEFCDFVIAGKDHTAETYGAQAVQDPLQEIEWSGRFQTVFPMFAGCRRVLDVACGNGAFAIGLAQAHPDVRVVGLDYSAANIARAIDAAGRAGVSDRCTFTQLTVYDFDRQYMHQSWNDFAVPILDGRSPKFDGLFVGEFVEHVGDCTLLVDALEAALAPGALVIYTCPHGAWHELMPRGMPIHRGHVHRFHYDDIKHVWGPKADLQVEYFTVGETPRGTPVGNWIIRYRYEPGRRAGHRDLSTRAQRTRPFQRLSVGLITKNAEQDLARCLSSVWAIADEILVGDTGSTDDTKAIAAKFGARVFDLPGVFDYPDGFAGARNAVLEQATGDWFLWIDADEVLLGAEWLHRMLDGLTFNGYVLHQTHLYMDAPPTFDTPIRVFRRRPDIRFYGCIHEQPQMGDINTDIAPLLDVWDVRLAHTGYLTPDHSEQKRRDRNLPLLERDAQVNPTRELGKFLLLRDLAIEADMERAANRGQLTPRSEERFRQVVALFDGYLADPEHKLHKHARVWYEAAVKALGIGYEMEFAIAGRAGGMRRPADPDRVWVRSVDEFDRILAWKVKGMRDKMRGTPMQTEPLPVLEGVSA